MNPAAALTRRRRSGFDDTLVAMRDQRRTTIVMVSHDSERVRRIADRVTLLDRRVIAEAIWPTTYSRLYAPRGPSCATRHPRRAPGDAR